MKGDSFSTLDAAETGAINFSVKKHQIKTWMGESDSPASVESKTMVSSSNWFFPLAFSMDISMDIRVNLNGLS